MTIIRVIDFECSGLEPPEAQVCEVGVCDLHLEDKIIRAPDSWLCGVDTMPPTARALHHISLEECANCPPFAASDVRLNQEAQAVAFHNADFDTKFYQPDLPIICTYKSALRAWPDAPGHSNGALRYWLEDQGLIAPNHALTMPSHRAGSDAYVTAHVLLALFNAGHTGAEMIRWTKQPRLLPSCPIGQFRGKPWSEVSRGFLDWMMRQNDMESDLKYNAQQEINRRDGKL